MKLAIFNWDKTLATKTFEEVKNSEDNIKMASAGKDSAYFGHKISRGEKWKHRFEIAGILLGSLLIIPIPILLMTGSYKRLARCNSELNKKMIIEARINNLKDYVLQNKNSSFHGKLKEFESYNDREIIYRIKNSVEPITLGSVKIEITDFKLGKIGELIYSFDFNTKIPTILHKTLSEVNMQPEFAKNYNESDLSSILFGRHVQIFDSNGRIKNKYTQVFGAIHNFAKEV